MLTNIKINDFTRLSTFSAKTGFDEHFMAIETKPETSFPRALDELTENYLLALKRAGLSDDAVVFSRLFVSDMQNQKQQILSSPLFKQLTKGSLSVIEQKPVNGGPVSLLSYHLRCGKNALTKERFSHSPDGWQNSTLVKGKNYSLLLTVNFTSDAAADTYSQTKNIFGSLDKVIARSGMRLRDNTIRTWVFVSDIDANYADMVKARKELFIAHGLTEKSRYLASTGIQGRALSAGQIVSIDSLSIGGLRKEQIIRMEAPANLSPTFLYGVTFERGLRVQFGDRSHLYISGTASINNKGEVLFPGDAALQTSRTIENIRALLAAHHASINDMAYIIAYVRDLDDRKAVHTVLSKEMGNSIPLIFAEGAVCRPAWLVELEGVAVIPDKSEFPPFT
jgi:enamine deaminase RidA (YjgF/YER057c/UK114 family)